MVEEPETLTVERAGQLIDEFAATSDDARDIGTGLRETLEGIVAAEREGGLPSTALWTIWAFEFHHQRDDRRERFTPSMVLGDGTANMPFLRDLPDECLKWWADVVEVVTHSRGWHEFSICW
jgi:hypothetical protein